MKTLELVLDELTQALLSESLLGEAKTLPDELRKLTTRLHAKLTSALAAGVKIGPGNENIMRVAGVWVLRNPEHTTCLLGCINLGEECGYNYTWGYRMTPMKVLTLSWDDVTWLETGFEEQSDHLGYVLNSMRTLPGGQKSADRLHTMYLVGDILRRAV